MTDGSLGEPSSPRRDVASPTPSLSQPGSRSVRRKTGCLTCRLRKKRCDEAKPVCHICTRLGLDCMGYDSKRPVWMNKDDAVKSVGERISKTIHESKSRQMRDLWTERASKRHKSAESRTPAPQGHATDETIDVARYDRLDLATHSAPQQSSTSNTQGIDTPTMLPDYFTIPDFPGSQSYMPSIFDQTRYHNEPSLSLMTTLSADPSYGFENELLTLVGLSGPMPNTFPFSTPSPSIAGIDIPPVPRNSPFPTIFPLPVVPSHDAGGPDSTANMVYFHHYLNVILPIQYKFDNQSISDLITPLAFRNAEVFRSLSALGALHMASRRGLHHPTQALVPSVDLDFAYAQTSIDKTIAYLNSIPSDSLGSEESILAAMTTTSFYLYRGGNVKGWREAADLVRRCLAGLSRIASGGSNAWDSHLDLTALTDRLGHYINPIVWTDILVSVTEGKASHFLHIYRKLLLLDQAGVRTSKLMTETVMGCDGTTRLAMAETIALSDWKQQALRMARLSYRDLVERATSIELLLSERRWREKHLFEGKDPVTKQRKATSDVFYHGVRVLLATVVNGCHPSVPEISSAVNDTALALSTLDQLSPPPSADRLLVMPITLAGCHAGTPALQQVFRERFVRLGEDGAAFGNTSSALALMEEVWKRRDNAAYTGRVAIEIDWRAVMFELGEDGVLLI